LSSKGLFKVSARIFGFRHQMKESSVKLES
jgi:hypothetical protein